MDLVAEVGARASRRARGGVVQLARRIAVVDQQEDAAAEPRGRAATQASSARQISARWPSASVDRPRPRVARRGPASTASPRRRRSRRRRRARPGPRGGAPPAPTTRWVGRASRTSLATTTPSIGRAVVGLDDDRRRARPPRAAPRTRGDPSRLDLDRRDSGSTGAGAGSVGAAGRRRAARPGRPSRHRARGSGTARGARAPPDRRRRTGRPPGRRSGAPRERSGSRRRGPAARRVAAVVPARPGRTARSP